LVATAARYGDKLLPVLSPDSGVCDDGHWHDIRWYQGGFRQLFNDNGRGLNVVPFDVWVAEVVGRYASSPAIAMWEPVGEADASTCAPGFSGSDCVNHLSCPDEQAAATVLRSFFDLIGSEIHRADPHHLVESGVGGSAECGMEGSDGAYVQAGPGVDVTDVHDYGSDTVPLPGVGASGEQARLAQAEAMGKPAIVGEVGILASSGGGPCVTPAVRLAELERKVGADLFAGFSGVLAWDWVPVAQTGCSDDIGPEDPLLPWVRSGGPGAGW
jgi:hypothetical protein